jgi:hypothetical protein
MEVETSEQKEDRMGLSPDVLNPVSGCVSMLRAAGQPAAGCASIRRIAIDAAVPWPGQPVIKDCQVVLCGWPGAGNRRAWVEIELAECLDD